MSEVFEKSLRRVLELASSDAPAPGGGSVSALAACFGLSMTVMVGSLTIGKKKYHTVEAEAKKIVITAKKLADRLESLVQEDMDVFSRFMTAMALPKNTPEEQNFRGAAMEEALHFATETPLEIARVCLDAMQLTLRIAVIGNKTAISDAGVAVLLLDSALNGALLNVEANTCMLKDQTYSELVKKESETLSAQAADIKQEAIRVVQSRIE